MPKNTLPAQMSERSDISAQTQMSDAEKTLALRLNVDVTAPIEDLVIVGVEKTNKALRLIVEAGLNFLAVRERAPHGEFLAILEAAGIDRRRAHEAMVLARGLAAMPMDHADKLLKAGKSKALLLAGVDATVMEALIDDESIDIDLMSVRALRQRIADLESATTDLTVQRDKAETEVASLRKQAERGASEDRIPLVIADMRAEAMVLAKQASLAVESHGPLAEQIARLTALDGEGPMWVDGTVRLVLSGLAAQRMLVEAQIARWLALLPEEESNPLPDAFSYLSPTEIQSLAREWPKLTAVHEHGKALREWEREQARPRGKGRPNAKPQAPKA